MSGKSKRAKHLFATKRNRKGIRMGSFLKSQIWLLMMFICAGLTSCEPTHRQATTESLSKGGSEDHADMGKKPLSREQIIDAANTAARERGWKLEESRSVFDEDNARWRSVFSDITIPEVEGHDYQVIIYIRRAIMPSEPLWVAVDRSTGKVLRVVGD